MLFISNDKQYKCCFVGCIKHIFYVFIEFVLFYLKFYSSILCAVSVYSTLKVLIKNNVTMYLFKSNTRRRVGKFGVFVSIGNFMSK